MKRFALLFGLVLIVSLLTACGTTTTTSNTTTTNPTVTMGATTFNTTSVTIPKGGTITFTDDVTTGTPHILVVGKDGTPDDEARPADFGGTTGHMFQPGQSWTTPPWNTPGAYSVTCTIHPTTMTLTVTVTG
jgi:plastocyanin